jgi:hypothetical protein
MISAGRMYGLKNHAILPERELWRTIAAAVVSE